MSDKNSTLCRITVIWMGEEINVDVHSFTAATSAPIAYTPDCEGYDNQGSAAEVDYSARYKYPVVEWALDRDEDFRALVIEEMSNE